MTHRIRLSGAGQYEDWRQAARNLILHGIKPQDVEWDCESDPMGDLFAVSPATLPPATGSLSVPKAFVPLAERLICHRDTLRFALAYRLLWRLQAERSLLGKITDPEIALALGMIKSVDRDCHKMKAFVRFKEIPAAGRRKFVAWFEPDHYIVRRTAPFFQRRFTDMDWIIATPKGSAGWDGERLQFDDQPQTPSAITDETDELWRTYFASIFNPARLKVKMMQSEMPRKYWKNLPEADLIPELIRNAEQRVKDMAERPLNPSASRFNRKRPTT
ncbi:MAG: TIGR03915 family putative DNA repair protein [Asticcacaulis sp.]